MESVLTLFPHSKLERRLLKVFLLTYLHKLFAELFKNDDQHDNHYFSTECYMMDNKIIQSLIQNIIDSGEYTLEGIAHYTRIPFDVIFDASQGKATEFTITPWARVVDIFTQVKPEVTQLVIQKLLELKENKAAFSALLNE